MIRGKHAASENSRLRADLREASDARRRLEGRLAVAEKELAGAREWRTRAEATALPEVLAERERADAFATQAHNARSTEREEWVARLEMAAPFVERAFKFAGDKPWLPSPESPEFAAMLELFGDILRDPEWVRRNMHSAKSVKQAAYVSRIVDGEPRYVDQ